MTKTAPGSGIPAVSCKHAQVIADLIDGKTKPIGALGRLEELAARICAIQETLTPSITRPHIVVFAGDHGIATDGVSAYPQSVTYQMVYNFLAGGAAINVFARQHDTGLEIVDAGVNHEFGMLPGLIDEKIRLGTRSFLESPAMTQEECRQALEGGVRRVEAVRRTGCNTIGFGEMGIGNSSSAAAIMSCLCQVPIRRCVGRGAGLDDLGLARKVRTLEEALALHGVGADPLQVLATFGGFEIAMMSGAMLKAAEGRMLILVDGYIATAALLVAHALAPRVLDYCAFSHLSSESGHGEMLRHLGGQALLSLGMRLGEGTGAALALPLVRSAVGFVNEMASFETAGVDQGRHGR